MKHLNRILALVLALMLILGLATTAYAEDQTYSITIKNDKAGHTYEAYQIFTGDLSGEGEDADGKTSSVLSNIVWGTGVTQYDGKALTENVAAEVAKTLTDQSALNTFIGKLTLGAATKTQSTQTDGKYVIDGLTPGYYLIKDKNDSLDNTHDAYTAYIIEVVEDSTVTVKSAYPTVDKQVQDEAADKDKNSADADGWGETADHEINESFQFKLIATLPADTDFAAYETYKVIFEDTISKGITYEKIVSVKINNVAVPTDKYILSDNAKTSLIGEATWSLAIANVKTATGTTIDLTQGATIEVIYTAHLNDDAAIGNTPTNKNTVNLQYSNNPNAGGSGDMGKATPDSVLVFTYEVTVNKVDGQNTNQKLPNAEFQLKNAEGKWLKVDTDGRVEAWVDKNDASTLKSDTNGLFKVIGLDAGTYTLVETKAPEGYNLLEGETAVVISAEHVESGTTATTTIKINNVENGEITVKNNAGTTLPETGGIGTTIFYVVGGLLVLAAIVLLVTKKRMASAK